jgi:hypothetical protein
MIELIITIIAIIITPLITKEILIPWLMHPRKFGGIPFKPPGFIKYSLLYIFVSYTFLTSISLVTQSMKSIDTCNKIDIWEAIYQSKWILLFIIIGFIVLFVLPIIKAPLLVMLLALPYSTHIATGVAMLPFSLCGHYIASKRYMKQVC